MARPGRAIRDVPALAQRQILAPMDTLPTLDPFTPPTSSSPDGGMTRRGLLRAGVLTGGGLVAVAVAACAKPAGVGWTLGPTATSGAAAAVASPSAAACRALGRTHGRAVGCDVPRAVGVSRSAVGRP